jgi:DNA-binding NtrC family response regulator
MRAKPELPFGGRPRSPVGRGCPIPGSLIPNPNTSRGTPHRDRACHKLRTLAHERPRILIADDQKDVLAALRLLLKREGYAIEQATSPPAVRAAVEATQFDVALVDLNYSRDTTSGREGLDLLTELQALDATLPVVVMTAWGSVEGAVSAIRAGARDYIEKPWENDRLLAVLRTQIELARSLRRTARLEDQLRRQGPDSTSFVARSRAMQPVLRLIERVGPSDASLLITGEHGSGKEVVAQLVHRASPRRDRSLVTINAGGLPDGLLESELFGHVKGAFTDAREQRVGCFELADGGTLFLDEIANMPLAQQTKLLRVLQTGEFHPVGSSRVRSVDVRVLAATNADLQDEVRKGRFRDDLLYRLNTIEIELPPLRSRTEDIPELAALFLRRQAARYGKGIQGFSPAAERLLLEHDWPGNVRELEHAVERGVLLAEGEWVDAVDLALRRPSGDAGAHLERMTLEDAEAYLIRRAFERAGGNVSQVATELGLSRSALYRRLQRFGITP